MAKKTSITSLSEGFKQQVVAAFQPLVDQFIVDCVTDKAHPLFNTCSAIYSKWEGKQFFLVQTFWTAGSETGEQHDVPFVRLTHKQGNLFSFAYFHHTNTWKTVDPSISLENCVEMIEMVPTFHPV
jgi:hypothetical protein